MGAYVRPACLGVAFVATAVPASAQTWTYEPDVPRARVYEPRYEPRYYEPRAYEPPTYEPRYYEPPTYESRAYEPAVSPPPLALTPPQRPTIHRPIPPGGPRARRVRGGGVRHGLVPPAGGGARALFPPPRGPPLSPRRLRLCLCRRLAGRRCLRPRADAPGGSRHCAGRTLV